MKSFLIIKFAVVAVAVSLFLFGCRDNPEYEDLPEEDQVEIPEIEGLVHYYPLKTNAIDYVTGADGVVMGNGYFMNYSLYLDGQDTTFVRMPNGWLKDADEITIEMWVFPIKFAYWQSLFEISIDNAAETNRKWLTLSMSGDPGGSDATGPILKGKTAGTDEHMLKTDTTKALPLNQWSHIAFTFSNGIGQVFVNGILAAEDNGTPASNRFPFDKISDLGDTQNNWIGRTIQNHYWGNPNFRGNIMDYRVYYRVLDASEIKNNANNLQLDFAVQWLDLADTQNVTVDIDLPVLGPYGSTISWSSDKPQYFSNNGNVTMLDDSDTDIVLTATVTLNGQSETKIFNLHIPSRLECDKIFIANYLDYILSDGESVLPSAAKFGSTVTWQKVSGNFTIFNNTIYKNASSLEREPVKLRATINAGGNSGTIDFNNVTIMDPYAAFVLAYFDDDPDLPGHSNYIGGNRINSSSTRLAYGFDGVKWEALNGVYPVVMSTTGTKMQRDPFVLRMKGGRMMLICTQGWSTNQIYFWDTDGLTNFYNERLVQVSWKDVEGLKGDKAWAPEASYDPVKDIYYVYWSDSGAFAGDSPIYYNTTKDFWTVSQPGIFYNGGRCIIDGSIFKYEGVYYFMYKDETGPGKDIWIAKSGTLDPGSFRKVADRPIVSPKPVEGPFMFKSLGKPPYTFFMYYDFFSDIPQSDPNKCRFGYSKISDLSRIADPGAWTNVPRTGHPDRVIVPQGDGVKASHGGVIPVTYRELERIRRAWNKDGDGAQRSFKDLTDLIAAALNEKRSSTNFNAALITAQTTNQSASPAAILSSFNTLFNAMEDLYK